MGMDLGMGSGLGLNSSKLRTLHIYACICICEACERCLLMELSVMKIIEVNFVVV